MRTKNTSISGIFIFVLIVAGLSACKASEEESYGRWDADANTMMDRDEFGAAWTEANYYGRWDANRDNYIDESEWNAGRNAYMRDVDTAQIGAYSDWDADGDGRLDENEFRDRTFDVYDTDRDGGITENEYNTWWGGFNRTAGGM
ncbi:hypothetical protein D770_17205 [Flammeovirgaceae bacterium 311]|nr:hypothetical protein D770_17205 [Flammeovirgaceae bacterium 311]